MSDNALALLTLAGSIRAKFPTAASVLEQVAADIGTTPVTCVTHVAHADPEEYARIYNIGYEAAMTQQLADDPGAAEEWLAKRIKAEVAAALEGAVAELKARADDSSERLMEFEDGYCEGMTDAARIVREQIPTSSGGAV